MLRWIGKFLPSLERVKLPRFSPNLITACPGEGILGPSTKNWGKRETAHSQRKHHKKLMTMKRRRRQPTQTSYPSHPLFSFFFFGDVVCFHILCRQLVLFFGTPSLKRRCRCAATRERDFTGNGKAKQTYTPTGIIISMDGWETNACLAKLLAR